MMKIPFHKPNRVFALFISAMLFTACSDNDETAPTTDNTAIAFECQIETNPSLRSSAGSMHYFRVSAIWDREGSGYESFMSNQLVERDGIGWVYSPVRYWPAYGRVSFFAYSPAQSSGLQSFDIDPAGNHLTIAYKLPVEHDAQEDFLVATSLENTASPVHLQFEHALACAAFWVRSADALSTVRLNKIVLRNLNSAATLTGAAQGTTTSWAWEALSAPDNYTIQPKYPIELQNTGYMEAGSLMVLPQPADSSFEIEITYNGTETTTRTLDSGFEFEMGKKYAFYLEIG